MLQTHGDPIGGNHSVPIGGNHGTPIGGNDRGPIGIYIFFLVGGWLHFRLCAVCSCQLRMASTTVRSEAFFETSLFEDGL